MNRDELRNVEFRRAGIWGLTMLFSCGKLVLFIVEDFCGNMEKRNLFCG